jgi:hypothetical protein
MSKKKLVLIRVHSWFTSQRNLRNQRQRKTVILQNKPNFPPVFFPSYAPIPCALMHLRKYLQFCNFPKTNPIQTQSNPIFWLSPPAKSEKRAEKSPQLYVGGHPKSRIKYLSRRSAAKTELLVFAAVVRIISPVSSQPGRWYRIREVRNERKAG